MLDIILILPILIALITIFYSTIKFIQWIETTFPRIVISLKLSYDDSINVEIELTNEGTTTAHKIDINVRSWDGKIINAEAIPIKDIRPGFSTKTKISLDFPDEAGNYDIHVTVQYRRGILFKTFNEILESSEKIEYVQGGIIGSF